MKRKAQKESTHARVLSAAKDAFKDRDVRDVSMNDVAARAETSVGSLYLHFRSRDLLMDAVVTELAGQLTHSLKETLGATDDPSIEKAIKSLAATYVAAVGELRPYMSLYADHMARTMTIDRLRGGGVAAPLLQMLAATLGSLNGRVPMSVDVHVLASSLVSLWRGTAIAYAPRPLRDGPVVADSLASMTGALLRGVCPKLFELDARPLARAMSHYLKDQSFLAS
jgi:AcrR family transcriptional regulator